MAAASLAVLDRLARRRVVWTFFILEALVLLLENSLTFPLSVPFMRAMTGQTYLDFCVFCSSSEVYERVATFGPVGRSLQLWLLASIDVLIPLLSGLTGLVALRYFSRGLGAAYRGLLFVPLLATLLDFAENATIAAVVLRYPARHEGLGTLLGLLSGSKLVAYAGLCLCVLWVSWARRSARAARADR